MSTADTQALTEDDLTVLFWELVKKEDDKFRDSEEAIAACDYFREGFRAALALAQPAPQGWRLMPVEPTAAMVEEICERHTSGKWPDDFGTYAAAIRRRQAAAGYSAAIEAAPALPLAGDAPLQGEGKTWPT